MEWDKIFSLLKWVLLLKRGVGYYVGRRWWEPEFGLSEPRMGLHGLIVGKKQFTGWVDIAALAAAIPQSRQDCGTKTAVSSGVWARYRINQCIFSWVAQTCLCSWNKNEQKTDANYPRLLSSTQNIVFRACCYMWLHAHTHIYTYIYNIFVKCFFNQIWISVTFQLWANYNWKEESVSTCCLFLIC